MPRKAQWSSGQTQVLSGADAEVKSSHGFGHGPWIGLPPFCVLAFSGACIYLPEAPCGACRGVWKPRFRSPCFLREGVILSSLRLVGHEPRRDSGLNSAQSLRLDCTSLSSDKFLHYFFTKAVGIRALISPFPSLHPFISVACPSTFNQFEPVSLSILQTIIGQMNTSSGPTDTFPPILLLVVWDYWSKHLKNY